MIVLRLNSTRILFIHEYWVLVPIGIGVNVLFLRKHLVRRSKVKDLKKLRKFLEQQERILRIFFLAVSYSAGYYFPKEYIFLLYQASALRHYQNYLTNLIEKSFRGGEDRLIDVDYINCGIKYGLQFIDNDRIRKIVFSLYKNKRRGKVIYITATALCYIVARYGKDFLALPFAVGDFGVTSLYQATRKTVGVILVSSILPLFLKGYYGSMIGILLLAYKIILTDLDTIPTTPVYDSTGFIEKLQPRIPDVPDVVTVNFRDRLKISSGSSEKRPECYLAEQLLTERFTDIYDLGQPKTQPDVCKPQTGKTVNFLEKFGDTGPINDDESWETSNCPIEEKKYLRGGKIRND